MRKKVDSRIRTLIENGVKSRHRSLFVVVGDKNRDQVVNLHYMLSKAVVKSRPSVLWCYKKDLFLSSHKKKRMKQIKKMMKRGLLDAEKDDPFSLFVASTSIRYCYYAETEKILGNTFGMCVLQDFEALTPNLLARTIETVEGGGIILLLLSSLSSLTSLYTMMMDVHSRFRTESHEDVVARFNERFILSLASCKACIFMDDELNILQVSSHVRSISSLPVLEGEEGLTESEKDLKELKDSLVDTQPAGPLVSKCKTLDQGKAVVTFLDAISEKTLRSTVALTASRGRGKSAALGLAIAGAVAFGYSNIFVTAPSPENLKTLFEFVCKGFDALEYKEHIDYDLVQSTNPAFNKAVVRVNIFRQHRQTIQYIQPQDHAKLAQAELLIIDEAAAIPLPMVKALLGPYLVFMCSTVNGYEGTGRSLSLKLIQQLRSQGKSESAPSGRVFREVELAEPIRYGAGDPIEGWLHELLCLNAADHIPSIEGRLPPPSECRLFYVNRDTLFSYHKASELFLQRMMALYVASHYKNTPNDLQLLSDAPAHHLFVLLGPVDETQNTFPDILCVIQVCLEGKISRKSALKSLSDGSSPSGDQIPWKVSQQFQDSEFPSLSGARIVRIAVHPNLIKAGYGSAAVNLLVRYYEGQFTDLEEEDDEDDVVHKHPVKVAEAAAEISLLEEQIKPRANLPPLLVGLHERNAEKVHYVGVSYGLTQQLHNFWKKLKFVPVYVSQIPSAITGEHSCVVLRPTEIGEVDTATAEQGSWVRPFNEDFSRRFISLLGSTFRSFSPGLALSVLKPQIDFDEESQETISTEGILGGKNALLTPYDMKRLESYANNLADYHLIIDLVPTISRLYFMRTIPVTLSACQAAILLCIGLQQHDISFVESALDLPRNQVLALFNKSVRKLHGQLHKAAAKEIEETLPRLREVVMNPHAVSVDEDLEEAAAKVKADQKEKVSSMLNPESLQHFAIGGNDVDFEAALGGKVPKSGLVSVKSSENKGEAKKRPPQNKQLKNKSSKKSRQ
ncbi:RNA cytidine acetyltransferase 1 [Selaginella moellendorffii]|uniref:RNA cytidine acetyltransferase 1 n=1 Tax=Selaginella moellendorffii TaxID=88036 RepID=UPI000D1C5889|nr:RNA cytidine acetyltransferase 1 [Selaginella moellendorffii]|eukprot:XP_024541678.1 RNA cytidine acetyltransferase 1 [Selaginella moellendorffii]